eukprot:9024015-Pyramimonas_sp.AAC.1
MNWIGPDSTPWAQQFATDTQTAARVDEGAGRCESRDSGVAIFEEGSAVPNLWLQTDPRALCSFLKKLGCPD